MSRRNTKSKQKSKPKKSKLKSNPVTDRLNRHIGETFISACQDAKWSDVKSITNQHRSKVNIDIGLEWASEHGNLEMVKFFIRNGADVTTCKSKPLGLALKKFNLQNESKQIIKCLIDCGADVHWGNDEALIIVTNHGDLELVKYLISKGANLHARKSEAFRRALQNEYSEILGYFKSIGAKISDVRDLIVHKLILVGNAPYVEHWIKKGAPIDTSQLQDYFQNALKNNHRDIIKLLLKHVPPDLDILSIAAEDGDLAMCQILIECGADIHHKDDNPLIMAIQQAHSSVVKYLVKQGANIYVNNDEPIERALSGKNIEIVDYLLSQGADLYLADNKYIIHAINTGNLIMTQYLISKGANTHIPYTFEEKDGPIHYASDGLLILAIFSNHLDIVKLLVNHGADVNLGNGVPLECATVNNYVSIIKYLKSQGATSSFLKEEPELHRSNSEGNLPILVHSRTKIKRCQSL